MGVSTAEVLRRRLRDTAGRRIAEWLGKDMLDQLDGVDLETLALSGANAAVISTGGQGHRFGCISRLTYAGKPGAPDCALFGQVFVEGEITVPQLDFRPELVTI